MEQRNMQIDSDERVEFYSPFAHIPDRYEVCRIHAEGYGSFDVFILIEESTARPVTVYVHSDTGSRFMAEQYPRSACIQLLPEALRIQATGEGRGVACELDAETGPLRSARLHFEAAADAVPEAAGYGGREFHVWGSRYYCRGVDLNVLATVTGSLTMADGSVEEIDQTGIIALGSVGIIGPRQ
jgi:hypothetical protein